MQIFLLILLYIVVFVASFWVLFFIYNILPKVKQHKQEIDEFEKTLYSGLRDLNYHSRNITKYSKKINKYNSNLISEFVSFLFISVLPFKKIKRLMLLNKLTKYFLYKA